MLTSSVRCRCDRPPMVLLGEMRHCTSTLLTFTRPYFGTARSMSNTFAVSTYSGGSSSRSWMLTRPALRSRLSCARRVRISLARCSASIRWVRERSGVATAGFVGIFVAGGMGGESTSRARPGNPKAANSARPLVEVQPHGGHLTVTFYFAGLFQSTLCYSRARIIGSARDLPAVCADPAELRRDPGARERVAERFGPHADDICAGIDQVG